MTHEPIIVSVPHTGTRFLKERLGVQEHAHVNMPWGTLLERIEGRSIIVPLRKPASVWRSWCRRHVYDKFPYGDFFVSWGHLHALSQIRELDVICVDKNRSDPRIDNWRPVGDEDSSLAGWKLLPIDLRAIHKIPLVEQHYGPHQ